MLYTLPHPEISNPSHPPTYSTTVLHPSLTCYPLRLSKYENQKHVFNISQNVCKKSQITAQAALSGQQLAQSSELCPVSSNKLSISSSLPATYPSNCHAQFKRVLSVFSDLFQAKLQFCKSILHLFPHNMFRRLASSVLFTWWF